MAKRISYIVKVSGVPARDGAGEYDGGNTLLKARAEAKVFARRLPGAKVSIATYDGNDAERLDIVEVVSQGQPGAPPRVPAFDDEEDDRHTWSAHYRAVARNGWGKDYKSGGQLVTVLPVEEEDRKRWPFELGDATQIAFLKSRWLRVEVPEEARDEAESAAEDREPLEPEDDDYVVGFGRHGGYDVFTQGRSNGLGHFRELDDAMSFIRDKMHRENFYPNIWAAKERGDWDLIDGFGNMLRRGR